MIRIGTLALCLLAVATAFAGDNVWKDVPINPVKSADKAVELAMMYSGFDKLKSVSLPKDSKEIARTEKYVDTTTPFLAGDFSGRRAWCIELDRVVLEYDMVPYETAAENPKMGRIYIDSLTGKLLEIRLTAAGLNESDYPCIPDTKRSSQELSMFREKYEGHPAKPPQQSPTALLRSQNIFGMKSQIIVMRFLVQASQSRFGTTPSWIIDAYGTEDPDYGNHFRWVYDDATGMPKDGGNYPFCEAFDLSE